MELKKCSKLGKKNCKNDIGNTAIKPNKRARRVCVTFSFPLMQINIIAMMIGKKQNKIAISPHLFN